mgnify:FL=1|jgi:hypothetical protein|tara:strand:- start:21 stop:506 length:486 start_codon:yes stop_codon:yes gene_type:complete
MKDVEDYINNVLDEKRPEFGGKRVCPFAAHELSSNKLMIAELGDKSLIDLFREFKNSDYDSALFVIKEDMPAEETKNFQVFVNKLLEYEGMGEYKNICFNPNDKVAVDGYNPRSQAPYFMVNIASRKVLGKAARALKKTNYYDNMRDEYLAFLKVKKVGKK